MLRRLHAAMARVELDAGDLATAEKHVRWLAEARGDLRVVTLERRREQAGDQALSALVLARLGRVDEARPLAAKALAFQRELHALGTDDQLHKLDLALALVAAAWTDRDAARAMLAEAQSLLETLPADARALRTGRWTEALLADAGRAAR